MTASHRYIVAFTAIVLLITALPLRADWFGWRSDRNTVKGSGDLITVDREVDSFDAIENYISADIVVKIGEPRSLKLTFDDNLIDLVSTEVYGHALEIRSEDSYSTRSHCKLEIVAPSLEEVAIHGSGDVTVDKLAAEDFELRIDGSGDFAAMGEVEYLDVRIHGSGDCEFHDLKSEEVFIRIHGSGDLVLDGKTGMLDAGIYGSGNIDARDLEAADVDINVFGSGDSRVTATERLTATVNGSGDVTYYGNPKDIDRQVRGTGRIRSR